MVGGVAVDEEEPVGDQRRSSGVGRCDATDDDNELDINKIEEDISSSHDIITQSSGGGDVPLLSLELSNKNHHDDDDHESMKEEVRSLSGGGGAGEKMNIGDDQPSPGSFSEPMECGGNSLVSLNSPKNTAKILEDVNMSENNSVSSIEFLRFFLIISYSQLVWSFTIDNQNDL